MGPLKKTLDKVKFSAFPENYIVIGNEKIYLNEFLKNIKNKIFIKLFLMDRDQLKKFENCSIGQIFENEIRL